MTEEEKKSYLQHIAYRGPGKRQVKPTAALLAEVQVAFANDDEDDDEDFIADGGGSDKGSVSGSESGSDSESGNEDVDEESADKSDSDDYDDVPEEMEPICALCFNMRVSTKNDEHIQCDKCGLIVHEGCYLPHNLEDPDNDQQSSTEAWFCEPCLFGFDEPPHCELCPDRYGVLKRSDIGGRWVHQTCALFTPGVTFGDIDHLTAISWQEMDHRNFGRKSCNACSNKLEARTGVATRCELGMCKNYYHATCAQRLGLLVDHTLAITKYEDDDDSNVEPRYINCKRHSNPDDVKQKKLAYARFFRQEEKRMLMIRRKVLSPTYERKRLLMKDKYNKAQQALFGLTVCYPDASFDQQSEKRLRRARHLHTSSRYLESFREKAEMIHVDAVQFEQEFLRVHGDSLPFLCPGFTQQFVEYFRNRESTVIGQEKQRLQNLRKSNAELRKKQEDLLLNVHTREEQSSLLESRALKTKDLLTKLHSVLSQIGAKKIKLPPDFSVNTTCPKKVRGRKSSISVTSGSMSGSAPTSPIPSVTDKTPNAKTSANRSKPVVIEKIEVHACSECNKTSDQHTVIKCDSCLKYYHLACLDPPLDKMPKKTNYDWYCSNCCDSDEEENAADQAEDAEGEGSKETGKSRKLRQRSSSIKARRMKEAEEQNRAYRSAIALGKRGSGVKRTSMPMVGSAMCHSPNGVDEKRARRNSGIVSISTRNISLSPVPKSRRSATVSRQSNCPEQEEEIVTDDDIEDEL